MKKRILLTIGLIVILITSLVLVNGCGWNVSPNGVQGNSVNITNSVVENTALTYFNPELRQRLASIPIEKRDDVKTAMCLTVDEVSYNDVGIYVSNDWDNINLFSPFWDTYKERGDNALDPVFDNDFKKELLIHEYLHIAQAENTNINITTFYSDVLTWFYDSSDNLSNAYGVYTCPDGYTTDNYIKYILWSNLLSPSGQEYYADEKDIIAVEYYAYIGEYMVKNSMAYLVPENIREYYRGILLDQYIGF